jgi:hypothetical protein
MIFVEEADDEADESGQLYPLALLYSGDGGKVKNSYAIPLWRIFRDICVKSGIAKLKVAFHNPFFAGNIEFDSDYFRSFEYDK